LSIATWVIVLAATAQVQTVGPVIDGATVAVPVDSAQRPATGRRLGVIGIALPVGTVLAAGGLIFLVLPAGLGGHGFADRLARHVIGSEPTTDGSRRSVGVDTYGAGELSLDLRGTLPDTPVLHVPANSPPLWRGTFYSFYTGQGWISTTSRLFSVAHGNSVDVPPSALDPVPAGRTRTYTAQPEPAFHSSLIWTPGVPTHVQGVDDSIGGVIRQPANARVLFRQPGGAYRVTSTIAPTGARRLAAAAGADPIDPQWTQLPGGLPVTIGELARQVTAHARDRYDQVREIETYLRTNETYSLDSPVPGQGEDAVADFLFRDHTGFCEQFASAEAVMLRTLGVPARVVSGLAYGTRDATGRLYTAANAHAWVEVYYPGVGWSPSDPTAGATPVTAGAERGGWFSRLLNTVTSNLPGGNVVLVVIAILLIAGLVLMLRTTRGGWRRDRTSRDEAQMGPVLAAFERVLRHPQVPAPKAPAETAREYLARIAQPGAMAQTTATLEQECYGSQPPPGDAVTAAVDSLDGLVRR
jgi:transglutaminase-like putative cysteine protease